MTPVIRVWRLRLTNDIDIEGGFGGFTTGISGLTCVRTFIGALLDLHNLQRAVAHLLTMIERQFRLTYSGGGS